VIGGGSIFDTVRKSVDGFWSQFLGEVPHIANPNLRTGIKLTFVVIGGNTSLVDQGTTVVGTIHSASLSAKGVVLEVAALQDALGTADANGSVTLTWKLTLDTTQLYQIDLLVTSPDGKHTQTITQAVLLNPDPATDWGNVADDVIPVNAGGIPTTGGTSTTPTTGTIEVLVGDYDYKGNPVQGDSVQYGIQDVDVPNSPIVQLASGTTDSTGSIVVKNVSVTVVPADHYRRWVTINGKTQVQGGLNSLEPGHAILANGYLATTINAGVAS
jgi:hypothetical protein